MTQMERNLKKSAWFLMLLTLPVALYAQKDVTQFLGIPVDGSKSEIILKLKAKGYTISPYGKDVLDGEFNGTDVHIVIVTNNNKVWRIGVADANTMNEQNVKIRFNNLLQQFQDNKKYISTPDSTIIKYTIPEDEDISYELSVHNKRYQAVFYQKAADYDSLEIEMGNLFKKETLNDADKERLKDIMAKMLDFNKTVWINIGELSGGYYISIFYDNEYNRPNGDEL